MPVVVAGVVSPSPPPRLLCGGAPAVHDRQLALLVPPGRWRWVVDRWAFNARARSFKAGNRGELSFKARSPAMACSSRNAPQVMLARVAVMALARSEASNAAEFPNSARITVHMR